VAEKAPALNVYQCIAKVSEKLAKDGIAKDRKNDQQGYKFRGIDDVYNALAPILAEFGLVVIPRILSRQVTERTTQKGGVLFYVVVEAEFDFVSAGDGSKVTVRTFGEAMDSGDKATNKAMSAAYKYAAMQTFCIPTEGNNDADHTTHEVAAKAPDGYADWLVDLELVAAEQGMEKLQETWKKSVGVFRKLLTDTNKAGWEAIKAKAEAYDKAKAAKAKADAEQSELVGA
jgi:hypothetical protein